MTSTDTTKASTDTKVKLYFEGLSAEAITAKLRGQAKRVTTDIETFGGMIVEAYARQVHVQLDQSWTEFTTDVLAGFKPDTLSRKLLGAMMRAAGMENKDIADATGSSTPTIERDNRERGDVNPAKQAANKQAAQRNAKPDDAKVTDAIVTAYLRNMNDHAHVAALVRAAGYGTLLVPEYRHDAAKAKPVTIPEMSKPGDDKLTDALQASLTAAEQAKAAKATVTRISTKRVAGQHRTPVRTRRTSTKPVATV